MATTKSTKSAAKKSTAKKAAKTAAKKGPKPPAKKASASDEAAALWELCEEHAGKPALLEKTVQAALRESGVRVSGDELSAADLPAIAAVFLKLAPTVTPELRAYFQGLVEAGANKPYEHKSNTPGALCLLGAAIGSWAEYEACVRSVLGPLRALDRLRRLELEVCARHLIEAHSDEGGLAFLREQAKRYAAKADTWDPDSTAGALVFLLRRRDPVAIEALDEATAKELGPQSYVFPIVKCAEALISHGRDPRLLEAMRRLCRRIFGEHDNGETVTLFRAFGACGASDAELEAEIEESGDYRVECLRCAVAAGMIEREPNAHAERAAIEAIDGALALGAKASKHEIGACAALAKTMIEHDLPRALATAKRVLERGRKRKGSDELLLAWLEDAIAGG